jgi:hypothetical protein
VPPLSDVLGLLLPSDDLTLALRACLLSGPAGADAWERWLSVGDRQNRAPSEDGRRIKRLLPLLADNLRNNGVSIGRNWQPHLRAALVHEELRCVRYRSVCRDALSALHEAGVDAILVKGAALAETVYPRPSLRHCHDIDVLVPAGDLDRAIEALASTRISIGPGPRNVSWSAAHDGAASPHALRHESGLPIRLHLTLFRVPFYDAPVEHVRRRARRIMFADVRTSIPSAADTLVHVCGHAATDGGRETLVWACDAALVVRQHPDLDWSVVVDVTRRSRVALPVWVMLSYLVRHLEATIPTWVLDDLRQAAMGTDALRRQSAIAGVHAGHRGSLMSLWRASGWRSRLGLVRWALAPSPSYLRWTCAPERPWTLPLWYVRRPLRCLARLLVARATPVAPEASQPAVKGAGAPLHP